MHSDSPPDQPHSDPVPAAMAGLPAISGALALPSLFLVIGAAQPGSSLFSWHPTLVMVAYALVMPQALLVFSRSSVVGGSHRTKVWVHFGLNALAAALGSGGIYAIYSNKDANGWPHYTSWHGTFGLVAGIFTLLQVLAGSSLLFPSAIKPISDKLGGIRKVHQVHRIVGLLAFSLAYLALYWGLLSGFWEKMGPVPKNVVRACTVAQLGVVAYPTLRRFV